MKKEELRRRVEEVGIVPVIRTSSAEDARFAVEEVAHGGIPIIEVTMTVPGAIDVIREIVKNVPDVIIGAGTVLDAITARECINSGAQFISNPALDLPTVQLVHENPDVIMMSGALTPTEILSASKAGADFVKIFPCSMVGGRQLHPYVAPAVPRHSLDRRRRSYTAERRPLPACRSFRAEHRKRTNPAGVHAIAQTGSHPRTDPPLRRDRQEHARPSG